MGTAAERCEEHKLSWCYVVIHQAVNGCTLLLLCHALALVLTDALSFALVDALGVVFVDPLVACKPSCNKVKN